MGVLTLQMEAEVAAVAEVLAEDPVAGHAPYTADCHDLDYHTARRVAVVLLVVGFAL